MHPTDLQALLGDYHDDLQQKIGQDGLVQLGDILDDLAGRWDDDPDMHEEATNTLIALAFGDLTLPEVGAQRAKARTAELRAHAATAAAALWADRRGMSIAETARQTGATRVTIYKALEG